MSKNTLSMKPGILVGVRTSVKGGVHYQTKPLPAPEVNTIDAVAPETAVVERHETTKLTEDPAEHEKALKVRNAARTEIAKICALTPFGLLCPVAKEAELDAAIVEAERKVREFNKDAQHTHVAVDAIKGYVAENDEKAARGIANEIASLLADMKQGIVERDAEAIRASVRKAKALSGMIDETSQTRVSAALAAARSAANEIAETIRKRGDANLVLIADGNRQLFEDMATEFTVLDLEPVTPVAPTEALPVASSEIDIDLPSLDESGEPAVAAAPTAVSGGELDLDGPSEPADPNVGDVDASAAVDADAANYKTDMAAGPSPSPSDGGDGFSFY